MDVTEQATALAAITQVLNRYAVWSDRRQHDDFIALFAADDGEFTLPTGETAVGQDAIRELMGDAVGRQNPDAVVPQYLRHNLTTHMIDLTGEDTAKATSYFLVMTDKGLDHWGRWVDTLTLRDGRWLFQTRKVIVDGSGEGSWYATSFDR